MSTRDPEISGVREQGEWLPPTGSRGRRAGENLETREGWAEGKEGIGGSEWETGERKKDAKHR